MNESKSRSWGRTGLDKLGLPGVRQNLPLFCLANHNAFKHTVITMSNLVITLSLNY